MTIAAFILGLIGTLTGCMALCIQWLTYRRDTAKVGREVSRDEQASQPFFKWQGGEGRHASAVNRFEVRREFTNEGGAVTELEITAQGDIQAAIVPKGHIGERGSGKIELSKHGVTSMPEVTFEISYTTRLNKRSKQVFVWSRNAAPMRKKDE